MGSRSGAGSSDRRILAFSDASRIRVTAVVGAFWHVRKVDLPSAWFVAVWVLIDVVGAAIVVQGAQWLLVRDPSVFQGLAGLPPFLLLPLIIVVLGVGVPALAIKPLAARDGAVGLPGKPFWIRFGRPALAFWGAIVGSLLAAWLFGAVISVVIVGVLRQSWYGDIFTAPDSLFDLVVPALVTLFVVPPVGGALFARLTAPTAAPASSAVSM